MQFFNNGLNANALDTHARTDRIHTGLGRHHSDFGARTRFACDGADLDHAVIDFRNFVFQQTPQEVAMGARENDLRAARAVLDFQYHCANAVVDFKAFVRDFLVGRQNAFGLHVQADRRTLHIGGLYNAADDLAHLPAKVFHLRRAFCFADALLDYLTCSLRRNAAKV